MEQVAGDGIDQGVEVGVEPAESCESDCAVLTYAVKTVDPDAPGFRVDHPGVYMLSCETHQTTYPFLATNPEAACPTGHRASAQAVVPAGAVAAPASPTLLVTVEFGVCEHVVRADAFGLVWTHGFPVPTLCGSQPVPVTLEVVQDNPCRPVPEGIALGAISFEECRLSPSLGR